jgi:hypothetical protein
MSGWCSPCRSDNKKAMTIALEELTLLHTRSYDTKVYRDDDHMVVVGSVQDVKPPGIYIEGDPDSLEIHHMLVVLRVRLPDLTITEAQVEFRTHPNESCPLVIEHYGQLVGLSVARGFNRKVRELFGGPRACTHTTALLQAMAPVVVQAMWSVRMDDRRDEGGDLFDPGAEGGTAPAHFELNLNTCHVWAEGSESIERARAGQMPEVPIWIERRFAELGRDPNEWSGGL